jgi:hypothetical protein
MLKNFIKRVIIFGSPVILLVISYFVFDPFHILRGYDFYGSNFKKTFNRNRMSTEMFLRNNPKYHFKSFILGSSRSSAFRTNAWSKYINDPAPYHFDSFNDNISGMLGKLEYIEKQGNSIENALLVFDRDTFSEQFEESNSIVHYKDYRWTNENVFSYHLAFFKAFFQKQYFIYFLDLKINNTYRPAMDEFFKFKYFYTAPFNDFTFPDNEAKIKKDSISYYQQKEFKNRNPKPKNLDKSIKTQHIVDLIALKKLLDKNKTKYKVVFSPMFDQRYLDLQDKSLLIKLFGADNFYDYSGKNKYTNDISNYYEPSHFTPRVGEEIMSEIYSKK